MGSSQSLRLRKGAASLFLLFSSGFSEKPGNGLPPLHQRI
jgi:hypothetical protein